MTVFLFLRPLGKVGRIFGLKKKVGVQTIEIDKIEYHTCDIKIIKKKFIWGESFIKYINTEYFYLV